MKRSAKVKGTRRRSTASRKRLPRSHEERGPAPAEAPLGIDDPSVAGVVESIRRAGGTAAGAYREPLSGKPLVVALLPPAAVEPTPFQRELSPTHARRLAGKIDEAGSFLDPVIAVPGPDGRFWTPNGRHRLAAARALGLRAITALVSPDEALAFRILALNTEKAHNLRDRSLEVIRMARAIAVKSPKVKEIDHAAEFESPWLLTLGIIYDQKSRFSGGAYAPFLRKVERFEDAATLRASLRQREGWASRLVGIDDQVGRIVGELQKRGFRSPYLRAFVVARVNPVRWLKPKAGKKASAGPLMPIGEALTRMARNARDFRVDAVKPSDLALVAAVAPDE
ncbi:MAG: ParB N-terminal domain-containing protein [Candidatus Binatia bacterium]